jgi:serine phosphatase RsbU (regulator of sigma subunit)
LVRRVDGRVDVVECPGAGPPLGVESDPAYLPSGMDLASGEVVVLYSDGLVDAVDARDEAFGQARLAQVIARCGGGADEVGESILAAFGKHIQGRAPLDDVSIVCLGRSTGA